MKPVIINFPKRNRLLNKVFNTIEVCENGAGCLTHKQELDLVIERLGIDTNVNYTIKVNPKLNNNKTEAKRQDGQFITIIEGSEPDAKIHYVFFSCESPAYTRNGYIVSKLPVSYRAFCNDTHKDKTFNVFLLSVKDSDVTMGDEKLYKGNVVDFKNVRDAVNDYQTFAYKLCRTLGINILNFDMLDWGENKKNETIAATPFKSIKDMKLMRNKMTKANNKSSYIIENAEDTILYGKTFGNNGFEIILMAAAAKAITKGTVYLWQIKDVKRLNNKEDRKPSPITAENLELLGNLGIECFDELQDYSPNDEALNDGDARNQAEFMKNLMLKFGSDEKKCYLCDCNIQKLIIASHIHRVCDINKETDISFEEKRAKAVSRDNGLWLCANHDKLFENGLIYFDDRGQMQVSETELTDNQCDYIEQITAQDSKNIKAEHLTDEMKVYLSLHRRRTHH